MKSGKLFQIPPALSEAVAQGQSVLFLGADTSYSTPNWIAPPTRAELAQALADSYSWVPSELDLTSAAEAFLTQGPGTRSELLFFIQNEIERSPRPGLLHQHVVELNFDVLVSAAYDDLLETAMQEAGRRVFQVVENAEIAYAGKEGQVVITRLAGTVSQPESLILTRTGEIHVENHLSERLQAARGWCAQRALLFIGWAPEDPRLERLYHAATESLGTHRYPHVIIWPGASPQAITLWKRRGVTVIPADPLLFLQMLKQEIRKQSPTQPREQAAQVIHKLPYKFLNYFEPEDQDIFYGREIEAALVTRMALSYPLLTLFGKSGVGKASLLRAGVVPQLLQEGYSYAYVRALGDPLDAIREGVCRARDLAECPGGTLQAFFKQALGKEGRMVVILDQFEELFIRSGTRTRAKFWEELGACLKELTTPEVHFILSLRESYLAELDEARRPLSEGRSAPIPTILHHSYRLQSLDVESAQRAIVVPAQRANCSIEPQLVSVLLGHERNAKASENQGEHSDWSLANAKEIVPLPQLQIVMDRLYRHALAEAGERLPTEVEIAAGWTPPSVTITQAHYRTLGGAGKILADYVTEALEKVEALNGDREMAITILKLLVTSRATKAVLDGKELIARMAEADPDFDPDDAADRDRFEATRDALVTLRLVRRFKEQTEAFYELAHGHVAAEVATWVSEEEMQTKLARELLRREMGNWRSLQKLIEPAAFKLIDQQREKLKRLTEDEQTLLLHSAIAANCEVTYWQKRAVSVIHKVEQELCEQLGSANPQEAQCATQALLTAGTPTLIARLEALVEDDFNDNPVLWVDPRGTAQDLRRTVLNLTTARQQRALTVLTRLATPAAAAALDRWTPPGMRLIPAGSFQIGDTQYENESPIHEVWSAAFWIDRCPVTYAQWAAFLDAGGWEEEAFWTQAGLNWKEKREKEPEKWEAHNTNPTAPVRGICWYEALAYARWAGKALLNEGQWEKAARGPKGYRYPWGNTFDGARCPQEKSPSLIEPADPEADSPYGIAVMAGPVWEWCRDLYTPYPYDPDDGRTTLEGTGLRVVRGSAFPCDADSARAAVRRYSFPHARSSVSGVRVGVIIESP